jgi:hypothetical protein
MLLFMAEGLAFSGTGSPRSLAFDVSGVLFANDFRSSIIHLDKFRFPDGAVLIPFWRFGLAASSFGTPYLNGHALAAPLESFLAAMIGGGLMLLLAWGRRWKYISLKGSVGRVGT